MVFVVHPPVFVIPGFAGDGIPGRVEVLFHRHVQRLVIFPVPADIRIPQGHRLVVHVEPGFAGGMLAVQPRPVDPVVFVLRVRHRLPVHPEVRLFDHQPLVVKLPDDHGHPVGVRLRVPAGIVRYFPRQILGDIHPADFLISRLTGHGLPVFVQIPFDRRIPHLIKFPVNLEIQVALHIHRLSVRPVPFLVDGLLFVIEYPTDLGIPAGIRHRLPVHPEVQRPDDVSKNVQFPRLPGNPGTVQHHLPVQPVIAHLGHPAFRLVHPPQHGISAIAQHGRSVRSQIPLLIDIPVGVILPLHDGVPVGAQHQFVPQVQVLHPYDLSRFVIDVLRRGNPLAVDRRRVVFVQISRPDHPARLVQGADLSEISVHLDGLVLRIVLGEGVAVPVLAVFRQLVGIGLPRGQHQLILFVIVAVRRHLPVAQVFRLPNGIPISAKHRLLLHPQVRLPGHLPVPVVFVADHVDAVFRNRGFPVPEIGFAALPGSFVGIMRLENPLAVAARLSVGPIVHFRQDIPVLVRGINYPSIAVRPNGQGAVGMEIPGFRRLFVLVKIFDLRVPLRAVHGLFVLVIIGGPADPFPVVFIAVAGVSEGRMHHPFPVQPHIEPLGNLPVRPIRGPDLMVPVIAQRGIPLRVVIRFLGHPGLLGIFPGQNIVAPRHPVRLALGVKIRLPGRFVFPVVIFQFHIRVSLGTGAKLPVRPVIGVLHEAPVLVGSFHHRVSGLLVIIQISVLIQIGGLADARSRRPVLVLDPGIPVGPPHQVVIFVVIGDAGGFGPLGRVVLRIHRRHPGILGPGGKQIPLRVIIPALQMPLSGIPVRLHPRIPAWTRNGISLRVQEIFQRDVVHAVIQHPGGKALAVVHQVPLGVIIIRPGQLRPRGVLIMNRGIPQVLRHHDLPVPVHEALGFHLALRRIDRFLPQIGGYFGHGARRQAQQPHRQQHSQSFFLHSFPLSFSARPFRM